MTIGVLALQGAFAEHRRMLAMLGVESFEIRQKRDLERSYDGLIIPGGESTVQGKLLIELDLFESIRKAVLSDVPVFGTCAGLLLLAKEIENDNRKHLATMDIKAVRNAYGRQLGSFHAKERFEGVGIIPMTFIRAPYIAETYGNTKVLAKVDDKIVAAREGNQLVTAFHPELTDDVSVHEYFIDMIRCRENK
ncbi:MAG: pyridoxal 5'-phosphate synthase glutaminase subunit PdxT [Christensenellales bacterium]